MLIDDLIQLWLHPSAGGSGAARRQEGPSRVCSCFDANQVKTMRTELKVFIAGSRSLSKLSKEIKHRLDNIIERRLTVVIGDANGVDKAVQTYLSAKSYEKVLVFHMQERCRNNVGAWPIHGIAASDPKRKDFSYYSTKDRAMAKEADYGLMLWDGESRGTFASIVDLVRREKPVVVYVSPEKCFFTLRQSPDLQNMLSRLDPDAVRRLDRELELTPVGKEVRGNNDTATLF